MVAKISILIRSIRYWDYNLGKEIHKIDTGSQVCNLIFSKYHNNFLTTHGYNKNQIILWDLEKKEKIKNLEGHQSRIIYSSLSPCGENLVTGSGDETIRFWKVFPKEKINRNQNMNKICQLR